MPAALLSKKEIKMKYMILGITALLAFTASVQADECRRVHLFLDEAEQNMIAAFTSRDHQALAREVDNLIFWDAYAQVECRPGAISPTPVQKLSQRPNRNLNPYTAGFLLWLQKVEARLGFSLSPAELVRGRTFER